MRRYALFALMTLAALCALVVMTSCFGKEPRELTYDELIKKGRKLLEKNEGAQAYGYFRDAHELRPDASEAIWGMVISNGWRMVANLDGIIDILAGVYVYEPSLSECERACQRLTECDAEIEYGVFDRIRSSKETCLIDCPWGLQPYMFEDITECPDCECVRRKALEWIISTSPADCVDLCYDFDLCGKINPPDTFDLPTCIERCPTMYVEHHSLCYLEHLGECSRKDRTCFEHTIVGLQVLIRDFSAVIPPETLELSDILLDRYDQFYLKHHSWTFTEPPLELVLDGRFGREELHFIRAVAHAFWAFCLLSTAVNLDINTVTFDLHFDIPGKPITDLDSFLGYFMDDPAFFLSEFAHMLENIVYDPIFPGAFIVKDEDWAIPQITQGGIELGLAFAEFADMIFYMLEDTDRQQGKAIGYDDANFNRRWDEDETLTFRGLDITLTRDQAVFLAMMCADLAEDLIFR
ncbi:MAG TPA: hypothetical protein ENF73_00420, partial [Proteobacteria bacterium]|nr:hypothetical protein [Pseudomonadota bacterium]